MALTGISQLVGLLKNKNLAVRRRAAAREDAGPTAPWMSLESGNLVETVPLTVGFRGSLQVSTWVRLLHRVVVSTRATQVRFLQDLT